jgi:hypothetical protein
MWSLRKKKTLIEIRVPQDNREETIKALNHARINGEFKDYEFLVVGIDGLSYREVSIREISR